MGGVNGRSAAGAGGAASTAPTAFHRRRSLRHYPLPSGDGLEAASIDRDLFFRGLFFFNRNPAAVSSSWILSFNGMATEVYPFRPFRVLGVHRASFPCRANNDTTNRRTRLTKVSVSCGGLHLRRSSIIETRARRVVRLPATVGDADIGIAPSEDRASEPSLEDTGARPFIELLRQPYILGAFTVSVAVKAWEACGMVRCWRWALRNYGQFRRSSKR